jgi:hypothetical protein
MLIVVIRRGVCQMNSDKLQDFLQIAGLAAIVGSLIFVGLQVKQSQDIAVAGQYQARLESTAENFRAYLQSDAAMRVWGNSIAKDIQSSDQISADLKAWAAEQPSEDVAFRVIAGLIELKVHDNLLFQYQSGFLSEEAWQAFRHSFKDLLKSDTEIFWARGVYQSDPKDWRASFREHIDELIIEVDAESGQLRQ